ncbi:tRNA uridine-5-carboxymethylaminomethyl(34) synthesis enzyme MnmG [Buchnera aphidicola]|uniref:tRNA uridine-5-carboxymethylaminomethyl(34) synthesis enzyme MnmG n=1 Tax=Buchnera aphidicola TaxID=9 RepID=UPI003463FDE9
MCTYRVFCDVIVIGGGHAGTEAALASSRMGYNTYLLTQKINTLGSLSCNPSIGGIGKGHLVKEIDALGGIMAIASDISGIHFRILNATKGPAVQSTRVQVDRILYKNFIFQTLFQQKNLNIIEDEAYDLIIKKKSIIGVKTIKNIYLYSNSVVLATGTFLGGKIYIGDKNYNGGRINDFSSIKLSNTLKNLSMKIKRLKTGTPPRLDIKTIDFSRLKIQLGDNPRPVFSFIHGIKKYPKQTLCYITSTNYKTHDIIKRNLHKSPIFSGKISGIGPRYCPSIEDKIVRFPNKNSHQIFVEPEGLNCNVMYPNGISTSLPINVQQEFINTIQGFKYSKIIQPGYAVEYDFIDPIGLQPTLESKIIKGLFFAGQINGTTGYEEAGAQGLLAGLNAGLYSSSSNSWYPTRNEAYIGVLVDDLCTKGTKEPYRMFTARAEHRLILREDNADLRLTKIAKKLGLIDKLRWLIYNKKIKQIEIEKKRIQKIQIKYHSKECNDLKKIFNMNIKNDINGVELLKRTEINVNNIYQSKLLFPKNSNRNALKEVLTQIKYEGYIIKQNREIEKYQKYENISLPKKFDYCNIIGLSNEVIIKLNRYQPVSIGQASRISGVTPAAISILLVFFKKKIF